jgi:glycerol uptake facilitator-like aquaporin
VSPISLKNGCLGNLWIFIVADLAGGALAAAVFNRLKTEE